MHRLQANTGGPRGEEAVCSTAYPKPVMLSDDGLLAPPKVQAMLLHRMDHGHTQAIANHGLAEQGLYNHCSKSLD